MTTITNPKDQEKIRKMMTEISNSYTRISAERDLIKETIEALSEDFEIDKKILRKMAQIFHKQNYTQVENEQEELSLLYESIVGEK
jgi:ribosomal protein S17E